MYFSVLWVSISATIYARGFFAKLINTSSDWKNRCITKNCIYSLSNLGNGMCQMTFLSTLEIYGVKNSLIIYLWMLKSPIVSVVPFPRFKKMNKIKSFLPTFSTFWPKKYLFTFFKTSIFLRPYYQLVSN